MFASSLSEKNPSEVRFLKIENSERPVESQTHLEFEKVRGCSCRSFAFPSSLSEMELSNP